MTLHSLKFHRVTDEMSETRSGVITLGWDASSFHGKQFRMLIKIKTTKSQDRPALTAKVADALRGDALASAMEIGISMLMDPDGLERSISTIQSLIFPTKAAEAWEWLKFGAKPGGPFSRMHGEPMTSYISRRKCCWSMQQAVDSSMVLGDTVLGGLLI